MSKAAARKKTTTAGVEAHLLQDAEAMQAVSRFWASTFGMGWRLAITVLIPLVAGVKLDERFNTSPSCTITGFMIAVAGASVVVWNTVKEVNAETAETSSTAAKSPVPTGNSSVSHRTEETPLIHSEEPK